MFLIPLKSPVITDSHGHNCTHQPQSPQQIPGASLAAAAAARVDRQRAVEVGEEDLVGLTKGGMF